VFSAAISGQAYARHGTTIDTRLIVIDRIPADAPHRFPTSPGKAATASELLDQVIHLVPPRPARAPSGSSPAQALPPPVFLPARIAPQSRPAPPPLLRRVAPAPSTAELAYEIPDQVRDRLCEWAPAERGRLTAAL
jgi:hypothetical protein